MISFSFVFIFLLFLFVICRNEILSGDSLSDDLQVEGRRASATVSADFSPDQQLWSELCLTVVVLLNNETL